MPTCRCGHVHCCHPPDLRKAQVLRVTRDDDGPRAFPYRLKRLTCGLCGAWISDTVIPARKIGAVCARV